MAYSREIIKKVLQYVRFRVPQTEEKNSYYTEIGNTLVRISNHCTRLRVWDEILEKNPKWKGKPIISIVFEDDEDTFDEVDCLVLKRFRMKPIKVTEYVYRLQGDPQFITPQDERLIISGIKQVQGGKYTDLTNKCSEPILRVSQNPPSVPPNNQELNTEQYMDKKLIRLTESDLHKIVKESVNKILRESILSEIDLQVEPQRYGEFWLRDKNTWIEFTAEVWVDRTHLECNVYSNGDDARGEQLTNSKEFVDECLHAIINSGYEDNIEGIQEYLDMYAEKGIDYDEAIHQLESNIGRF